MSDDLSHARLIERRKACRVCMQRHPGKIRNSAEYDFDPDVVSHWSQWLGHPQPDLLVIGQDFGNVAYFEDHRGQDNPANQTNAKLADLLREAGFDPGMPPNPATARVYLANAVLCAKVGKMNTPLRTAWVRACAEHLIRPLANVLKPLATVGMGGEGWRSVRIVYELAETPQKISAAAGGSWRAADGTMVFAVGHCGLLGQNGPYGRCWVQQQEDWRRIGVALEELQARSVPWQRCSFPQ